MLDYNHALNLTLVGDDPEAQVASLIAACRTQHGWTALVAALLDHGVRLDEVAWRAWAKERDGR